MLLLGRGNVQKSNAISEHVVFDSVLFPFIVDELNELILLIPNSVDISPSAMPISDLNDDDEKN